ncbi:superinfection immunity protein [Acidithiobacillus sp. M4-SHS-6]|uniref:superinfection immunity protein n=1 Tax=Acidithiobacillus sp. M4-SHS-6 TaxID=3383024 RepID=UPI0039BDC011
MTGTEFHILPLYLSILKKSAIICAAFIGYLLPSLWCRTKKNRYGLYLINFFLGWTVIGWWWCWELATTQSSFNRGPSFKRAIKRGVVTILLLCCGIFMAIFIALHVNPGAMNKTQVTVVQPAWNMNAVKLKCSTEPFDAA